MDLGMELSPMFGGLEGQSRQNKDFTKKNSFRVRGPRRALEKRMLSVPRDQISERTLLPAYGQTSDSNSGKPLSGCCGGPLWTFAVVTNATPTTITTVPANMKASKRSLSTSHPRNTATNGFTYA